jgi:hypothetical protein
MTKQPVPNLPSNEESLADAQAQQDLRKLKADFANRHFSRRYRQHGCCQWHALELVD